MTSPRPRRIIVALFASLLTIISAKAQTVSTWNNTGTNWSSSSVWANSNVPDSNTEKATFAASGSPQNPNVDANFTINGITFASTAASYTFGGTGLLTIDANSASTLNTIQVNGNQTFNVDITTANSNSATGQRFVIGTSTGTMNFGSGHTLTVGAGGLSLQVTGAGSGAFNIYGAVSLGANSLTQGSAATPVYFRQGSSITGTATGGIISNSAGNMYFETDNITFGGSAQITMFGSLASDAGIFMTKSGLNINENVRIANTASGQIRTVGVDIVGGGTSTWSGNIDISQNSGTDIARTVKFTASAGNRGVFSGNIISSSTTVFTDALQIEGGGTVVMSGTGNTYTSPTTVSAGTILLANNTGSTSATGGNSVTINGSLGGIGRLAPAGTAGLVVNSGGSVAPGDGGIGTLSLDLASTTGVANFASGSTFTFDLAAPGSSDVLAFTGLAASGDVTFNGNTINFTNVGGLGVGTYTLFTFNGSNLYTGTLAIGTGLGSFTGNLNYNAGSITLDVVPEPSTVALAAAGGMFALFGWMRRKQA